MSTKAACRHGMAKYEILFRYFIGIFCSFICVRLSRRWLKPIINLWFLNIAIYIYISLHLYPEINFIFRNTYCKNVFFKPWHCDRCVVNFKTISNTRITNAIAFRNYFKRSSKLRSQTIYKTMWEYIRWPLRVRQKTLFQLHVCNHLW